MTFYKVYIKTIPLVLAILLLLSIGYIIAYPYIHPWSTLYILYQIINGLCLSYISAFIFYFITIHCVKQRDKKKLSDYLLDKLKEIASNYIKIEREIIEKGLPDVKKDFSDKDIANAMKNINMSEQSAPMIKAGTGIYFSWMEYMDHVFKENADAIDVLLKRISLLDVDLIRILGNLENHNLNSLFRILLSTMRNKQIQFQTDNESLFNTYRKDINELTGYYIRKCELFGVQPEQNIVSWHQSFK
jgi:hypothetical protein